MRAALVAAILVIVSSVHRVRGGLRQRRANHHDLQGSERESLTRYLKGLRDRQEGASHCESGFQIVVNSRAGRAEPPAKKRHTSRC